MSHGPNGTNPHRFLVPVSYGRDLLPRGALLRTWSRMPAVYPDTRIRFVRGAAPVGR